MIRSPLMTVMVDAVLKAAKGLRRDFGEIENLQVSRKGPGDFVSLADHRAENILREALEKARPDFGFVMEESGIIEAKDGEHRWHIDPLDGTTNFLHGLPIFAVSVALWDSGDTQLGVVHSPAMNETFTAIRGQGAYLNNKSLWLSGSIQLSQSLIATGFPYYEFEKMTPYLELLSHLMRSTHGLRRMGSAAIDLAYVAAGRFDAFYEMGLAPWDVAAGALLVEEAGGFVSNFQGGSSVLFKKEIIAAHPSMGRDFLALVSEKLA